MSRVVSFHYVLFNREGQQLDSSRSGQPFPVMEGKQQIIPGLEEELFKMNKGDKKKIHIPADKAYGQINEKMKIKIGREKLPQGDIQIGTRFAAGPEPHAPVFIVIKIEGNEVHLDGNHPLAGEDLTFEVEVMEVREATEEELQHGHAHGPEGHHHH